MSRTYPPVTPIPDMTFSVHASRIMIDAVGKPGDTLADVAGEYEEVFLRKPACDERRAPLLRGLATELSLAGIAVRCGVKIETVIEDGDGIRVLPRFEDGLLRWIVDGYENMSKEKADA